MGEFLTNLDPLKETTTKSWTNFKDNLSNTLNHNLIRSNIMHLPKIVKFQQVSHFIDRKKEKRENSP